jgi:hypothetical protein
MHRQLEAICQQRPHHQCHLFLWGIPFGVRFNAIAARVYPVRGPDHALAPCAERNPIGHPDQNSSWHTGRYDASPRLKLDRLTWTRTGLHRYSVKGWQCPSRRRPLSRRQQGPLRHRQPTQQDNPCDSRRSKPERQDAPIISGISDFNLDPTRHARLKTGTFRDSREGGCLQRPRGLRSPAAGLTPVLVTWSRGQSGSRRTPDR